MKDIREMIDRYLDERMSHDEEQEFFRYLRSAELPEEFHEERELILQMAAMQETPPPPAGMEERLSTMIDNLAQESSSPAKRVFTLKLRHVWRAAAVVAIVAATGLAIVQHERNKYDIFIAARNKDTYATPEEAFQVYKKYKEQEIKCVADLYKSKYPQFPQKVYDAMYSYQVEITD